jgi:hypothetical protein
MARTRAPDMVTTPREDMATKGLAVKEMTLREVTVEVKWHFNNSIAKFVEIVQTHFTSF